ncbi:MULTISPECIES: hypothetical protein [Actinotignum]|uniref:Uncharacterized protein n=1 Tax=Actinotignum schaalii FB123-CNA-2 TaxID=883067 RepID=S2VK86_9ACTO|nr:hypothetical protein [Actinotignum schaalii]EPD27873.1 hypothetical protein HMPREF9237_00433 [Actinotignum schaalii FB123-CNA-2]MDK6787377.1 hypothetical protein [Actinotignum timonense]
MSDNGAQTQQEPRGRATRTSLIAAFLVLALGVAGGLWWWFNGRTSSTPAAGPSATATASAEAGGAAGASSSPITAAESSPAPVPGPTDKEMRNGTYILPDVCYSKRNPPAPVTVAHGKILPDRETGMQPGTIHLTEPLVLGGVEYRAVAMSCGVGDPAIGAIGIYDANLRLVSAIGNHQWGVKNSVRGTHIAQDYDGLWSFSVHSMEFKAGQARITYTSYTPVGGVTRAMERAYPPHTTTVNFVWNGSQFVQTGEVSFQFEDGHSVTAPTEERAQADRQTLAAAGSEWENLLPELTGDPRLTDEEQRTAAAAHPVFRGCNAREPLSTTVSGGHVKDTGGYVRETDRFDAQVPGEGDIKPRPTDILCVFSVDNPAVENGLADYTYYLVYDGATSGTPPLINVGMRP